MWLVSSAPGCQDDKLLKHRAAQSPLPTLNLRDRAAGPIDYLRPAGNPRNDVRDNHKRSSPDAMPLASTALAADASFFSFDRIFHRFIHLPSELRIKIYKFAFIGDRDHDKGYQIARQIGRLKPKSRLRSEKSIRPFSEDVREDQKVLQGTPILAVAFTCREVYLEAAPIYYGSIIWHFHSRRWLAQFLETLGRKNKIQGIGLRILEAVRHFRIKLRSSRMMALAAQFPHLHRLDIFHGQLHILQKILNKTFPTPCPQKMPLLKTLNYSASGDVDFHWVIWSRDNQSLAGQMTNQWYHFRTSRQLRLFSDAIGQTTRDSIKAISVQFDYSAMADKVLRFKNLVTIRLSLNRGVLQRSTFDTLCDKLETLRAGLPFCEDIKVQDPRDPAKYLPLEDFPNAFEDGTIWNQTKTFDTSDEESSREPTPAAWASS